MPRQRYIAKSLYETGRQLQTLQKPLTVGSVTSVAAHNILSLQHTDTVTDALVRGDLLTVNPTPKLDRLAHPGGANYTLQSSALDTNWVDSILKQVDQNAAFAGLKIINADAGASTFSLLSVSNAAGGAVADSLSLVTTGTGFGGAAGADTALVAAGANLSGGLRIQTEAATPIVAVVDFLGTPVEGWRLSTTEFVVNEGDVDLDTRFESLNQTHMLFVDGGNDVVGIRSSSPSSVAEGLHVPWITGDADTTAYFGSINVSNNQIAVEAETYSNIGLKCSAVTGSALVADCTGAGDIAQFRNSGSIKWTFENSGNLKAGGTGTLDLSGNADALILDNDADSGIGAPIDDQIDFKAGGTNVMHIISTGVGIGTSAPATDLEVRDTTAAAIVTVQADTDSNAGVFLNSNGATRKALIAYSQGENSLKISHSESGVAVGLDQLVVNEGRVGIGVPSPSAKLHVDQTSTTATIPVVYFDQADVSEEMFEFATTIGVGNAIEAVGAKTLTVTHFIKVTLPGGLTRYFPVGTIA